MQNQIHISLHNAAIIHNDAIHHLFVNVLYYNTVHCNNIYHKINAYSTRSLIIIDDFTRQIDSKIQ